MHIVMPTSVHLPKPILAAIDRRAKALRISRSKLILRAIERELGQDSDWPPGFFERLADVPPEIAAGEEEFLQSIRKSRQSKRRPPKL